MGWDGMNSLEACVHGSHMEGNQLHVQGMDRSGGRALGCLGWTSIGIQRRYGRTSSWLAPLAIPSKHQIAPSVRLVGPSIVLEEPANRIGLCSGLKLERSKELANQFLVDGLVYSEKIRPLRPGEGVGVDGLEEGLIEILVGKELPINDVS
ncbi:hypothetical protein Tco_0073565 [Tanacetum coccineum]